MTNTAPKPTRLTHLCTVIALAALGCDALGERIRVEIEKANPGGGAVADAAAPGPSAPAEPPVTPPSTGGCFDGALVETQCQPTSWLKQLAYQACDGKGRVLSSYTPAGPCTGDLYTKVSFTCCPPSPPVTPPPTPTPPPATACWKALQGGATSCKTPATWKTYAADDCKGGGGVLTEIAYQLDCGGGNFESTAYTCCPPSPTPPVHNPCAGKSCGEPCRLCPPDDPGCVETTDDKRCNFVSKCTSEPTMCSTGASACPAGLTWCFATGTCVSPTCVDCCDVGPACKVDSDCGDGCTTCADGRTLCTPAVCGGKTPGQCFYFDPKCDGAGKSTKP